MECNFQYVCTVSPTLGVFWSLGPTLCPAFNLPISTGISTSLENFSDIWAIYHIFSSVVHKVQVIPAACSPAKIASSDLWGRLSLSTAAMKGGAGNWRALLCLVKSLSSSNFINLYWSDVEFSVLWLANNEGGPSQGALLLETRLR